MSELSSKIKAAKAARPYLDVAVIIGPDLAEKREEIEHRLELARDKDARDPRLTNGSPEVTALETELADLLDGENLTTLRFHRLPGNEWAILTSIHEARKESPVDRGYGYNYDAVCEAAARYVDASGKAYGVFLEDGVETRLTVEEKTKKNPEPVDEWADLYDILSGSEISRIRDTIWELNEYGPRLKVAELVKASGVATHS